MKRKGFFRKLDHRLMAIISAIVIPVIILSIALSSAIVHESRERVYSAMEKEFEVLVNHEMDFIQKIDEWYVEYVTKYLETMTVPSAFSSVKSISLTNEIGSALEVYGLQGFFFLEEKQEDCRFYLKDINLGHSRQELDALKLSMKQEILPRLTKEHVKWRLINIDQDHYYFKLYQYQNYTLGIGIDIKRELEQLFESGAIRDCVLAVTDGEEELFLDESGCLSEYQSRVLDKLCYEKNGEQFSVSLMGKPSLHAVPFAYIILQVIAWLGLLLLLLLRMIIRRQVIKPLRILQNGMSALDQKKWDYRITETPKTDDYAYVYETFNKMADDIVKSHEKDILLYQVRLDNMKLQVNPHLLLNSLTTIYSLAQTEQYQVIQKFTLNLVEYFRYCLRENAVMVPLKSEMRFVESYMEIQKIRYPDEMTFSYVMEKEVENALIPPLLLQNFIENAVKYARRPDEVIELLVNIRSDEKKLYISVCDTGKGMEQELLDILNSGEVYVEPDGSRHIGIWNCRRRMEAFYDQETTIQITSRLGAGTQVWIEVPYLTKR